MPTLTVNVEVDDHPAQDEFVNDRNTETGYIGGVGSGKTAGGVLRAGRHIADWNPGHTGVIVSPTVPMLRNVIIPEMRQWGLLDKPGIKYRRSENRIEYPNGSKVILESANNDRKIERLRGLNLAWAWMDEGAYLIEKVYQILSDRLRVGNYRNLFVTTTPRGFNWVYDEFGELDGDTRPIADGRITINDTTTSIVGVSTRANPGNPEDYIEREERQHTGQSYQQEVEGEFVQFEGLVYTWFSRDPHVIEDVPEKSEFDEFIYGVDWGYSHPAVILALGRKGDNYYVLEEFYQRRCTVSDLETAALDIQDRWMPGPMYCDSAEPSSIEQFNRAGLDARPADKSVTAGIQKVSSYNDNLYVRDACQNVINEFGTYRYDDDDDAKDEPIKQNDHAMDALRYALMTHSQKTESVSTVGSMRDLMG